MDNLLKKMKEQKRVEMEAVKEIRKMQRKIREMRDNIVYNKTLDK